MKKTYETPVVEKVEFQYQEQVVASKTICDVFHTKERPDGSNNVCYDETTNYTN